MNLILKIFLSVIAILGIACIGSPEIFYLMSYIIYGDVT